MKPQEQTIKEVERTNRTYADDFLATLAEKLGASTKASTVFGEPVERNGITVIPVAKARWGFGGGAGRREQEDGAGGGGGAQVSPIGFIEICNGQARFQRIHTVSLPILTLSGLAGFLLARSLFRKH